MASLVLPPISVKPNLVSSTVAAKFATIVIEVPRPSYVKQSKFSMQIASRQTKDSCYAGPQRISLPRWKHINTFYIIELSEENYYQALSLTHHPHYSILRSEFEEFENALTKFKFQHPSCNIKRILRTENFDDDFLIVINDFKKHPKLKEFVEKIDNFNVVSQLLAHGKLDLSRGNWKLDFGYASGQNLERDLDKFGVTRPRILEKTKTPCFLEVQKELSVMCNLVTQAYNLPLYHRVNDIHKKYAAKLHPEGLFPAWRLAGQGPSIFLEVHEDSLNDCRPLMSPVGVLSRIYHTPEGPIRLTKIGYSRKSLFDSDRRESDIKPIVKEFIEWERSQPTSMRTISNDMFLTKGNVDLGGVIEIQCHLERSVGLSPYIHSTIQLQKLLDLSRHQSVAILYNCVTNESPYFFYLVYESILLFDHKQCQELSAMSPVELGLWYHSSIWDLINEKKVDEYKISIPRRHQPHNGKRTKDINISMSIMNLIRLTDQYCFLDGKECKKQYPHSKAVAILMMPARAGGCHACGGLTSQNLLYTLSCVGLVPICVSRWGELAGTETAGFLERHYDLSFSEGRAEQFLSCCVASSPGFTSEQIENRICKWTRSKKQAIKKKLDASYKAVYPYRDGIWPRQHLYQPVGEELVVWTGITRHVIKPPAYDWPNPRGKRGAGDPTYWDQPTRSARKRVLGGNRRSIKGKTAKIKTLTTQQCIVLLPNLLEIVCQLTLRPLYLSINNLLGSVLGESRSIPNHRIRADRKKGNKGFQFSVLDEDKQLQKSLSDTNVYLYPAECKADGALHFARERNISVLSKYIFKLVTSHQASKQLQRRDGTGSYYLIHDNCRRTLGRREAIAVAVYISETRLLFVQKNDAYRTDLMSYCFLDK